MLNIKPKEFWRKQLIGTAVFIGLAALAYAGFELHVWFINAVASC